MTDERLNEIRERRLRLPEGPPGNYLSLIRMDILDLMNAVRDLKCSVNGRDTRLSRSESLYYIQKCELRDVRKRLSDAKRPDDSDDDDTETKATPDLDKHKYAMFEINDEE